MIDYPSHINTRASSSSPPTPWSKIWWSSDQPTWWYVSPSSSSPIFAQYVLLGIYGSSDIYRMLRRSRSIVWRFILQHRFRLKSQQLILPMFYRPRHRCNVPCSPEFKHQYAHLPIFIISRFVRHHSTSSFVTFHPAILNQHSWEFLLRTSSM